MKKEPQIFTTIDAQDVPVSDAVLDTLEQEEIQETLMRECIRQVLLMEGMKTAADLPENVAIEISPEEGRDGEECTISYKKYPQGGYSRRPEGFISIFIAPVESGHGPCGAAWTVYAAEADQGWGPMLYDVAIEYATQEGGGLISDRESVSPAARRVWDYYMNNRGDVTGIQLDDPRNTLTPTDEDNCDQEVAGGFHQWYSRAEEPENPDWMKSPLSKRWTKPPTMMAALRKLGKLVEL